MRRSVIVIFPTEYLSGPQEVLEISVGSMLPKQTHWRESVRPARKLEDDGGRVRES
ncbi:MAG: hypothetical protein BWY99_01779 [Synergistetes bacterium ADurb.BinA166]|nr:MAG: hypothetical protein BWY99_01779 [Synergistetes bacterium ADurb.BinA166]